MSADKRADEGALAVLHNLLAVKLTALINAGGVDAATLNAARQFLKDNGIKVLPNGQTPLERLGEAVAKSGHSLPFEGAPGTH